MDWYYTRNGEQTGPVSEEEFERLAASGVILPETLVWHAGLGEWQPYSAVGTPVGVGARATSTSPSGAATAFCSECGRTYAPEDLMPYGQSRVCADCKPAFLQRVREGVPVVPVRRYAGFWIRFVALVIDGLILGVIHLLINLLIRPILGGPLDVQEPLGIGSGVFFRTIGIAWVLNVIVGLVYQVYFLTTRAATPGKMALGLKVVTTSGAPISAGLAVARYFGYLLDYFILGIGFIIAAFDAEKRTLHDRLCNTRVIYAKD